MRYFLVSAFSIVLAAASAGVAAAQDVTLAGCVVKGEGHGYLLTNVPGDVTITQSRSEKIEPGPVGTSGASGTVFYWLEDDDDLSRQVGHRVEVRGELKGDVKAGELKVDPKRDWTELEIKSEGRQLTVQVPQTLFVVSRGTVTDDKLDILVRRVEPKRVRMLGASCE